MLIVFLGVVKMMTSPYEEAQRIKIEENTKRMKALNLPSLSIPMQILYCHFKTLIDQ
jgi:hypothetical protein